MVLFSNDKPTFSKTGYKFWLFQYGCLMVQSSAGRCIIRLKESIATFLHYTDTELGEFK